MKKYKIASCVFIVIFSVFVFAIGNMQNSGNQAPHSTQTASTADKNIPSKEEIDEAKKEIEDIPVKGENEAATEENKPQKSNSAPMTAAEKISLAEKMSQQHTDEGNAEENTNEYNFSDPAEEPQSTPASDKELTCTLSVRCDTILENIAWLDKEKRDIVPKDGVIFAEQTVTFQDGESVFDLLLREMKKNKIHMEFENTPICNSAYIEGSANLYEFDCGELSGWMYKVNGEFSDDSCSLYKLKNNDKVEWVYTCDLGNDVR